MGGRKSRDKEKKKSIFRKFVENPSRIIMENSHILVFICSILLGIGFFVFGSKQRLQSTPDLILTSFLIIIFPPGIYDYYKKRQIEMIESEFPDLLTDIAFARKSGLSISAAIAMVSKGDYGKLTEDIRWIHRQVEWGITIENAFKNFAEKYPTPLIRRSVSIITKASQMGGEIGQIIDTVAQDAKELREISKERKEKTFPYVMVGYMAFFIFLFILIALFSQFVPTMSEFKAQPVGGIAIGTTAKEAMLYKRFFLHATAIEGFFIGIIAGKISENSIAGGLKHSAILVTISYATYFAAIKMGIL